MENWEMRYRVENVLPELKKLKGFFEDASKRSETRPDMVAGSFGAGMGVFFGNGIQHCNFDIPASAMKLIYEHNKKKIEADIERLEKMKSEL